LAALASACVSYLMFLDCHLQHSNLHSPPTRRSSDLTKSCSCAAKRMPKKLRPLRLYRERLIRPNTAQSVRGCTAAANPASDRYRSEEHTSELQSREKLVCRLLLEKKKTKE